MKSMLVLGLLLAGCGLNDKFNPGNTGGNGDGGDADLSAMTPDLAPVHPSGAANGTKCTDGSTCQTGNCVDGVCCHDSSCGLCAACNINGLGYCSALSAGTADSHCTDQGAASCGTNGKCDGQLACQKYDNTTICGQEHCTSGPSRAYHGTAFCGTVDAGAMCNQTFDDCMGYACRMTNIGTSSCYIQCSCTQSMNYCDTGFHCASCNGTTGIGTCVHN